MILIKPLVKDVMHDAMKRFCDSVSVLLRFSPDMFNHQFDPRRGNVNAALGNFFFIVPLLVFEIMLTKKLDYQFGTTHYGKFDEKIETIDARDILNFPSADEKLFVFCAKGGGSRHPHAPYLYTSVVFPLLVSFLTLLCTSVGRRGGNPWWCGIRKDFCSFLVLNLCPMLQEYGNISYQVWP